MQTIKSFMEEYSRNKGLIAHQIESYNEFIQIGLQRTITEIGKITIELPTGEELTIKLGKVSIDKPQINEADGSVREILPHEARLRNLTYASPVFVR